MLFTIDDKLFESILKKKFNTCVGNTCEITEDVFKEDINKKASEELIKKAIRKYAFDSMRDIQGQISAFSKGVNINIKFEKPSSK